MRLGLWGLLSILGAYRSLVVVGKLEISHA